MRTISPWPSAAAIVLVAVCMVNAEERKADPQNDPQQIMRDLQKGHQSNQYVRDEPENLKVEDMTMDELRQRLSEFEAGKRDDRDGYIVANQLWFNYQGRKETGIAEGQHARQVLDQLKSKHPEFAGLTDFRLSDKIRHEAQQRTERSTAKQRASKWTPPDTTPVRLLANDHRAVGVYQFHLDFYVVPSDVELKPKGTKVLLFRQGQEISPSELKAEKTLSFVHSISDILPPYPDFIGQRFLACSPLLYDFYHAMNDEEARQIGALGRRRSLPWTNAGGKQNQFCGVLSATGDVVFSFGDQHVPDRLFFPLSISADGKEAAVMVGEKVNEGSEEGPRWGVGHPREILVWREGTGLKHIPVRDKSLTRFQIFEKYAAGEFRK